MVDITKCCGHCGKEINLQEYEDDKLFQSLYKSLSEIEKDEIELHKQEMCCSCLFESAQFFDLVDIYETTNEDLEVVFMEEDILKEGFRVFNKVLAGGLDDALEISEKMCDLLFQSYGDYGYYYVFNTKQIGTFIEISLYCKPESPISICKEKKHIFKLKARLRAIKARYGLELKTETINNRMVLNITSPINTTLCIVDFHSTTNLDNLTFDSEYYTVEEKEIILSNIMLRKIEMIDETSLKVLAGKA